MWIIGAFFCALVVLNLSHNPLSSRNTQMDEQGHLSYALHLADHHRWWPDFNNFHMYDRSLEVELPSYNYINHPPTFYWLAKLCHQYIHGFTTQHDRLLACLLSFITIGIYIHLGIRFKLNNIQSAFYVLVPFLIYMHLQIGFYNNDAAAILGGMLVTLATMRWFETKLGKGTYAMAALGLMFASVKLTALLLVGTYAALCVLKRRQNMRQWNTVLWVSVILFITLLLTPYAMLLHQTGSPAPETLGQKILMQPPTQEGHWARILIKGWVQEKPMGFSQWLLHFFHDFVNQVESGDTTVIPVLLILLCMAINLPTYVFSNTKNTQQAMMGAATLATLLTLIIHVWFSWQRYQINGWRLDSNVRYYFPLLPVYGMMTADSMKRIQQWARKTHETPRK